MINTNLLIGHPDKRLVLFTGVGGAVNTLLVCACPLRHSPEGAEAHTPNHVEKSVKYEQTQQQIEEHGL